jgi:hypothetical protein
MDGRLMTLREPTVTRLAAILMLAVPPLFAGCGKTEEHKKQVGPLKEWIVGSWAREDDPNWWTFTADGEFSTSGRLPITGSYGIQEPNIIKISISGAGAMPASVMLGVPLTGENKNLSLDLVVKDDEMRPASISSKTVFRKK